MVARTFMMVAATFSANAEQCPVWSDSDRSRHGPERTRCATSAREVERIELVGARTTYSLARQP